MPPVFGRVGANGINMQFDKELCGYQDYPGISEWVSYLGKAPHVATLNYSILYYKLSNATNF
jgi:hypothetical protein